MNDHEQPVAKSPSAAGLRASRRGQGSGASFTVTAHASAAAVRVARRSSSVVLAALCVLAGVSALGAAPASAGFLFGSFGENAGQTKGSAGMAIDQESGDIYVGDPINDRVDEFSPSGTFLRAWGRGVLGGEGDSPEEEEICTSECRFGEGGTGAGEFADTAGPMGLAVDNDTSSPSHGDVYVVDYGNHRVQKFDSSGKFLLAFGGHVNKTNGGNVCVAGEACTQGTNGTADAEFEWEYEKSYIAVGPGGNVYVGDRARVQVFSPNGLWKEDISLAGLSSEGKVTALAVNAAGDIFVKDNEAAGVREFSPAGVEMLTQFDAGSESITAMTLNTSGDLWITDTGGGVHFLEYDPSGQELDSLAATPLVRIKAAFASGDSTGELYVYGSDELEYGHLGVWAFASPAPGPLIGLDSESSTPGLRGTATLDASIDPENSETTYHFEYVSTASYEKSGFAGALSTADGSLAPSFEEESLTASLTGLTPGVTYYYRVVASNALGAVAGPPKKFEAIAPALVEGPWAISVTDSSVTLSAAIDPLGASTTYRLEFGPSTDYGQVFSGSVGEGMSAVSIGSDHVQGLQPDTTYHYRLLTSSEVGTVEGPDHTFTTQLSGGAETLPDDRGWELVSPQAKRGAFIGPLFGYDLIQAAAEGNAITYTTNEPVVGEGEVSRNEFPQILSTRTASAWKTQDVSATQELPPEGTSVGSFIRAGEFWMAFSPDLSQGLLEPGADSTPLSPEVAPGSERTLYLRDNATRTYTPLESKTNVASTAKFELEADELMNFLGATPDLAHVIFGTEVALTPESVSGLCGCGGRPQPFFNLYEWSAGRLQAVNVPPGAHGEETLPGAAFGSLEAGGSATGVSARAISSDGRWVVWRYQEEKTNAGGPRRLYVRDMLARKTLRIGGRYPRFESMSSDGSKIFFVETEAGNPGEAGNLYVFNTEDGTKTDLTVPLGASEHEAGVQPAVLGASEDGSYVYLVATGVLAQGATFGADNLYVLHDEDGAWKTRFVAALSSEDRPSWNGSRAQNEGAAEQHTTSRVSPNGHYVTFMSSQSLTGYDNRDAYSGHPDEEVYLYDAVANRLICASCNPSGARPVGVHDIPGSSDQEALLVDQDSTWGERWLAGSLPFRSDELNIASYQPRYLSDSGRLFFDSPDALVAQDTNGLEDVYEYEPPKSAATPESDSCTSGSSTYSARSGGCVSLISSGISGGESAFMDASENGDDAFFVTTAKLTGEDVDTAYDLYDAHVCTASVPCRTVPVLPPPCTSGDSCKAAPSPQPAIFGEPASETFNGAGNITPTPVTPSSKVRTTKRKKSLRCKKGTAKKHGRCVKQRSKKRPAKKSNRGDR